nr:mucin-5AC isoform X10 [Syngnathus scovelli]
MWRRISTVFMTVGIMMMLAFSVINTQEQVTTQLSLTSSGSKTDTTQPFLCTTKPATSIYPSSKPQYTSETTFGRSTPDDSRTKSTTQESTVTTHLSHTSSESRESSTTMETATTTGTMQTTTHMSPTSSKSQGSSTTPETATTMRTMQTTGNSPSTTTSITSTNTDISSPLPSTIPSMTTHMSPTSSKSQESSATPETATTMRTMQTTGNSPSTATSSTSTNIDISSPLPSTVPPMTTHMSPTSSKSQESSATPETATTMRTMQTTGNSPSTATSSTSTNIDISSPLPSTIPPMTTHMSPTSSKSEESSATPETATTMRTMKTTGNSPSTATSSTSTNIDISSPLPSTIPPMTTHMSPTSSKSQESSATPETATTMRTMQTTGNSPSTATSSTSTNIDIFSPLPSTIPPMTTHMSHTSSTSIQTQTSYPATSTERTPHPVSPSITPLTQSTISHTETSAVNSIATSPTITKSTPTSMSNSTATLCRDEDCQCFMGKCIFSTELSRCHCVCQEGIFGDTCNLGPNNISPDINTTAIPDRKVNITLDIKFLDDLRFPLNFSNTLVKKLEPLCKEAEPQAFKKVQVVNIENVTEARRTERSLSGQPKIQFSEMLFKKSRSLLKKGDPRVDNTESSPRSVLATSQAQYAYQNNATQINWLNTQLDATLKQILNDSDNIQQISQAFGNTSVLFKEVVSPTPQIKNIMDIQPFVECSRFPNYTAEVIEGKWQCVAFCNKMPDYCSGHGKCHNDLHKGVVCSCDGSSIRQYYGQRCDRSRWGPGFYGALFGSLAAALLIIIIVILIVFLVKKRRSGMWKRTDGGFINFEEDYFDFTNTGRRNLGLAGLYTTERLTAFREH